MQYDTCQKSKHKIYTYYMGMVIVIVVNCKNHYLVAFTKTAIIKYLSTDNAVAHGARPVMDKATEFASLLQSGLHLGDYSKFGRLHVQRSLGHICWSWHWV